MPNREHTWDLNVVSTDPADPEGLDGKTYGMISGGRKIQVGDTLPEGVVEGFVDRGVRILPDTGTEYIVKMGEHREKLTPRAHARNGAAEMALQKIGEANTLGTSKLPWGDQKQLSDMSRPTNPNMWLDIDPPTDEELEDMKLSDRTLEEQNTPQRENLDIQIKDANFPDPRTDEAVRGAVEDMLDEQFVGLKLLRTSEEHKDGVPDNIYFEAGDGSVWEWNSTGEISKTND